MTQLELAKLKLTGWRAVGAIGIFLAFLVWRTFAATSTVHAEALPTIKQHLIGELHGLLLSAASRLVIPRALFSAL